MAEKRIKIFVIIDPQKGFTIGTVPGGVDIGEPTADLLGHARDSIIILSQDFHPEDHIAYADMHADRDVFSRVMLKRASEKDAYHVVAAEVDGKWKEVETNDKGYITKILDQDASAETLTGAMIQYLWPRHCPRDTESCLYLDPIMDALPADLADELRRHVRGDILTGNDDRGNEYFVVRKGTGSDLDSNAIATQNDGVSKTKAPDLFKMIAAVLAAKGYTHADIYLSGLATNYCVETSNTDLHGEFVPALRAQNITADVHLVTDLCRGVPVVIPSCQYPDYETSIPRMQALGTKLTTADDVIRSTLAGATPQALQRIPKP